MMRLTEEESTVSGAAAAAGARQTLSGSLGAAGTIQVRRKNMRSFKQR